MAGFELGFIVFMHSIGHLNVEILHCDVPGW
jgi:hypothetical protein